MKSFSKCAAVLAGGLVFAGTSAQGATLVDEDFEAASPGSAGWSYSQYGTAANYSGDPHTSVDAGGGGSFYGWAPGGGASTHDLAAGDTVLNFDGWLASYTADDDYTAFRVEFFDGLAGAGSSLGFADIADGSVENGSTTPSGAWNIDNWSNYVTHVLIPGGAQSVVITYEGRTTTTSNSNDAYADNILIETGTAAVGTEIALVPEPGSLALLGLGGLALLRRRRYSVILNDSPDPPSRSPALSPGDAFLTNMRCRLGLCFKNRPPISWPVILCPAVQTTRVQAHAGSADLLAPAPTASAARAGVS